jgi:cation diffusion facilitator CzcD-associated flavoprotein CzcO
MSRHRVVIVGSGFAGLGMAMQLEARGERDFVVLEKDVGVGGTWRANHYPGCACDIPSHLYSFSFAQNPDWTHVYPRQPEILAYLERCARESGIVDRIRFGEEVTRAEWDEDAARWTVHTASGNTYEATWFVNATGGLSRPSVPNMPGLDRFEGTTFHSARWDHDDDLTGKRVAVVGTGASAIQFVPQIAPRVAHLTLLQRTPPWVVARRDRAISEAGKQLFRGPIGHVRRWLSYWWHEARALAFVGGNTLVRNHAERMARAHLEAQVPDPELRRVVTPDYVMGCKRVLISDDYYPALSRDNVTVVAASAAEVRPTGIVDGDGTLHEVDTILFGTGFDTQDPLGPLDIRGRDGVALRDAWSDGAEAYLGTVVMGFPNLFVLVGPNVGLGHNSMVFMIECQIRYVLSAMSQAEQTGRRRLALRPSAQTAFNDELHERHQSTIWSTGCTSWYLNAAGRNTTLWPGYTPEFWWRTRSADLDRFEPPATVA